MNVEQEKFHQSLRRIGAWGVVNPGVVPPQSGSPETWAPLTRQFGAVNTICAILDEAAANQTVQTKQLTLEATDEVALRATLREELHVVTQVGQALGKTVPGIRILHMPEQGLSNQKYVNAARALLIQATTYESVLVEHGLAHDFIAQLQAAVNAVQAGIDARAAARTGVASAMEAVAQNIALGRQFVKVIDATLTKALRNNPVKLAEWKSVKRVVGLKKTSAVATAAAETLSVPQPVVALAAEVKAA